MNSRILVALAAIAGVVASGSLLAIVGRSPDMGAARPGDTRGEHIVAHATWNRPLDVPDMVRKSDAIVRARVVEIAAGPTFRHDPTPGVPEGGRQEIPTENVTLEVTRKFRGQISSRFVVNRAGGSTSRGGSFSIAGDPAYEDGAEYVLFVYQVAGQGAWYTLAPDGRLEIPDGKSDALRAVVDDGAGKAAAHRGLARLEKEVKG